MKNLREIKTTIIGLIFFILGIAWFVLNYKTWSSFEFSDLLIPNAFLLLGIWFLLSPDALLKALSPRSIINFFKNRINGNGADKTGPGTN